MRFIAISEKSPQLSDKIQQSRAATWPVGGRANETYAMESCTGYGLHKYGMEYGLRGSLLCCQWGAEPKERWNCVCWWSNALRCAISNDACSWMKWSQVVKVVDDQMIF